MDSPYLPPDEGGQCRLDGAVAHRGLPPAQRMRAPPDRPGVLAEERPAYLQDCKILLMQGILVQADLPTSRR